MRFLLRLLVSFLLLLLPLQVVTVVEGFRTYNDLRYRQRRKRSIDPTHYYPYSHSLTSSLVRFRRKFNDSNNRFYLLQDPFQSLSLWHDKDGRLPHPTISIPTIVTTDRQQRLSPLFQQQHLGQTRNVFFTRRPSRRKFATTSLLMSIADSCDDTNDNQGSENEASRNLENANGNNEENGDDTNQNQSRSKSSRKKSWSVARMGGRTKDRVKNVKKETSKQPSLPGGFVGILAILMLVIGLSGLFGSSGDNPNYYYYSYQSSVYETRTYNDYGQLEDTSRKESSEIKSNIPGLSSSSSVSLPSSSVSSSTDSNNRLQDEVLLLEQQERRFDQLLDSIIQESIPQKSDFFW